MQPIPIGIKELQGNLSTIAAAAEKGKSFLVMRHAKPVFRIEPAESKNRTIHTMEDIKRLCGAGSSKDRNLSKKVDQIVYGV